MLKLISMAKDPAFLFYPGDWMGGTMIMTRHQKGCYMDLLIAQFNNGPLSLETIKTILGQDQAVWTVLSSKFKQDSEGNFSNVRLATEIEKRKQFSESRRINGSKRGKPKALAKAHAEHTVHLMEDENRNEDEIKNSVLRIEDCLRVSLNDQRWVNANKTNETEVQQFNHYLEKQSLYSMNPLDYKRYFAKLKGKYPDLLKRELTIEELREIAREMSKKETA